MATWITHLRVADRVCEKIIITDKALYFAGSIAPDTSIPPDISHWCSNADKSNCDVELFYEKYIANRDVSPNRDFYIGYYVHLLTDVLWQKNKIKPLLQQGIEYIRKAKQRWKNVDDVFLSEQKDFRPFAELNTPEKYLKKWFDYYSESQVKDLVKSKLNFIETNSADIAKVDVVAKKELEQFIVESSDYICENLIGKGIG